VTLREFIARLVLAADRGGIIGPAILAASMLLLGIHLIRGSSRR
jgi:hypothetical protein